ncbi:MAG: rod shape-determining protein MreC [Gammaproteobacteria bacterium]|nr:MAG: rod shape-determining protein MreC [Gammaproteobacteria bacterium]
MPAGVLSGILSESIGRVHQGRVLRRFTIKLIFTSGPSIIARLLVLVALSLVLIMLDYHFDSFEKVRSALGIATYPVRQVVNAPAEAREYIANSIKSRSELLKTIEEQRTQLTLQKYQLQKLESLKAENIRLRSSLRSSFDISDFVTIGKIINVDLDPFKHHVLINKGNRDNVSINQPILSSEGVIGQTVHVSWKSSEIVLISDPSHAIPVRVNRTGLRSIAIGTGTTTRLELPYIPTNTDIAVGDLLETSGMGGRFPAGYPVARITEVTNDPGQPFAVVTAEPIAKLDQVVEVLLVWRDQQDALKEKKCCACTSDKKQADTQ